MFKKSLLLKVFIFSIAILSLVSPAFAGLTPNAPATGHPAQTDDDTMTVIPEGETVQIGVGADLSNLLPDMGVDVAQAVRMIVNEYNADGGLLGFPIEAVIEDDRCTAEGAAVVAEVLVELPNLVGVIGHLCSDASIAASEIYEENQIVMVSPASTAGIFTARALDVVNRTAANDNIQGQVAARYIYDVLGAESIAVLHNATSFGRGIALTMSQTFETEGGELLYTAPLDLESDDAFAAQLEEIAALEPDLIYFGGYTDEAVILVETKAGIEALEDVTFFSVDGVFGQDFIDASMGMAEGTYITFGTTIADEEANADFDQRYEELWGVAPDQLGPFHAEAHDATLMILQALEAVAELDDEGNLVIDRTALVEAVRNTEDFAGLTGNITCNSAGDCGAQVITVYRVEDEGWVELEVPASVQGRR